MIVFCFAEIVVQTKFQRVGFGWYNKWVHTYVKLLRTLVSNGMIISGNFEAGPFYSIPFAVGFFVIFCNTDNRIDV